MSKVLWVGLAAGTAAAAARIVYPDLRRYLDMSRM
jgi:hypothetical protein